MNWFAITIGIFAFFKAARAFTTGSVLMKGGLIHRTRNPASFWISVASNLGIAALGCWYFYLNRH